MEDKIRWNVLIFPGGTEIGLEIARGLRYCKEVRLFSASNDQPNHAPMFYRHHEVLDDVRNPAWAAGLEALIARHRIDFVFPAHAYVIDALLPIRERLKAKVVLPLSETVRATRSKQATLDLFRDVLPLPAVYARPDDIEQFPVFVKPDHAYGAQGTQVVHTRAELEELCQRQPDLLIQEYLPGEEYTVDCLCDRAGRLIFCSGRVRGRIRMGTSMSAIAASDELQTQFRTMAEQIAGRLPLMGAWFFQLKADADGVLRLLEVEARVAGTMCYDRVRGVNFALLSLFIHAGEDVSVLVNDEIEVVLDRSLSNRYRTNLVFDTVYVDLDDTLVVHGQVNTELITFLYQCVNQKKRIVLVSKSREADKDAFLRRHRLRELFDDIIWLEELEAKAAHIVGRAIFIDDSFSQRRDVRRNLGIPTFDASMVEALLDDRL